MKRLICLCVLLLAPFSTAWAQPPVKNPTSVSFLCPDHAVDDGHQVDIVRESDGVVLATIPGGDPPLDAAGRVVIPIDVQPIEFGEFRFVVRVLATVPGLGQLASNPSAPSAIWERAPLEATDVTPEQ